ncbi:nucleotide-binding universal stress UspA family protein [Alkalispirillum mobile]|uniref:Nucleotide-binding universal stress UspA family protein n=1 Tax=Alkalispirillum mobile TaxID=85925 RepID=A0A498CEU0_9GAMM|nr:universal stress protein [Alkalispirillum mobile]RLK50938.1 nucleotide-binding universal stress UspA family protein [Alkalispirillum mobile]
MAFDIKTILYATDLGPRGPDVFRCVIGIAERFEAAIHIVHVVEEPRYMRNQIQAQAAERFIDPSLLSNYQKSTLEEVEEDLRKRLDQFGRTLLDAADASAAHIAGVHVRQGRPPKEILAEADRLDADCIILGSHRYSAVGEMIIGSVARKITMKSTRPVFLFPA